MPRTDARVPASRSGLHQRGLLVARVPTSGRHGAPEGTVASPPGQAQAPPAKLDGCWRPRGRSGRKSLRQPWRAAARPATPPPPTSALDAVVSAQLLRTLAPDKQRPAAAQVHASAANAWQERSRGRRARRPCCLDATAPVRAVRRLVALPPIVQLGSEPSSAARAADYPFRRTRQRGEEPNHASALRLCGVDGSFLATQIPERASQEGPPFSAAPPSSPSVATWHPVPR
jgi:hypothetical protein